MLCDITQLFTSDLAILHALPLWLEITVVCIWLVPLLPCLFLDNQALFRKWMHCHNTLSTAFWMAVIVTLPCIGSLLWFCGSFLPYRFWKRRTGGFGEFPLSVHIRRRLITALSASWLIVLILQFALLREDSLPFYDVLRQYDLTFEITFLAWAVTVVAECFYSVRRPVVFVRLSASDVVARRDLFGIPYFREENTRVMSPTVLKSEARFLRLIADDLFRNHTYSEEMVGRRDSFLNNGKTVHYQVVGIRGSWLTTVPDFIEVRYIGRGITRCRVCMWYDADGDRSCTETVLYRAVPTLTDWLIRAGMMLVIQAAAGSSLMASLHTGILGMLEKLFTA